MVAMEILCSEENNGGGGVDERKGKKIEKKGIISDKSNYFCWVIINKNEKSIKLLHQRKILPRQHATSIFLEG